jgi:pyridoxamine 5'-phosphate oxidase
MNTVEREDLAGLDPMAVLARWVAEAVAASLPPTMTFATADASGTPHARTVLITMVDATSVRFHSSRPTTKTLDIAARPQASGVFYWPGRQVVVRGLASELPAAVSRASFPSRPLGLRRLAWAYDALGAEGSDTVLAHGDVEQAFAAAGAAEEMPPSWTTIQLVPDRAEFWQAGNDDTPAVKTRFLNDGRAWTSHPALP